jgi:hypothetical protein
MKSERREEGERGYRDGCGKPRRLTLANGTIEVRRPRIRDLEARFRESDPAAVPATDERSHRVASRTVSAWPGAGRFDLAMRGLLGHGAPRSGSTMLRVKHDIRPASGRVTTRRDKRLKTQMAMKGRPS